MGVIFESVTSDNNVNGAAIIPSEGKIVVGAEASYQVSVGFEMSATPGGDNKAYVSKNGEKQVESVIDYSSSLFNTGDRTEYASRNFLLQLVAGDELTLVHESATYQRLARVKFCVALMKA